MIIKALFKVVTFVAFTPIPEYAHMIGRIASVAALDMACKTDCEKEEIEIDNPYATDIFGFEVQGVPKTITKEVHKDTAGDVWMKLLPLSDDFSIHDAIETYNGLNWEQKDIFILSAIAAGCEAFYVISSFIRLGTLTKQRDIARKKQRSAEFTLRYAVAALREQAERESSVIDFYERNHAMIDWSIEAERANYNNVTGSVKFLRELAEELGGSAA